MTRNVRFWIVGIAVLAVAFLYVQRSKSRHTSSPEAIFSGKTEAIHTVRIHHGQDTLELARDTDAWRIVGHDTLEIRQHRIDNLFDKVLAIKRSTAMTQTPGRWPTYSVDDSTGTHLTVMGEGDAALGEFVFGRSKSDWSKNYVRLKPAPTVYLTDSNVIYQLSTTPTYWGAKPKPPEPDSLQADSASVVDSTAVKPEPPAATPEPDASGAVSTRKGTLRAN